MIDTVVRHEMAARLARIEAAFVDLPEKLHAARDKYNIAADSLRLLKAMIALTPDSPARLRLLAAAEITISNLYALADVLSTLVSLELAASDYRVMVGLLIDEMDSYEGDKPDNVICLPVQEKAS